MPAAILAGLTTAALALLGKIATAAFFEAVLARVVCWSIDTLAPKTSNTLDDAIAREVRRRLLPDTLREEVPANVEELINNAVIARDFAEAARLENLKNGVVPK